MRPAELLSSSNDVFISVPKKADPEFLKSIILDYAVDISEKDLEKLINRVEKVYCGISEDKTGYSFEAVVVCDIPKSFASSIFTSKRGFSKMNFEYGKNRFEVYSQNKLNLSFPESNLLCISSGSNVTPLLEKYADIRENGLALESNDQESDFEYIEFLENAGEEINFFSSNPMVFISKLTGFVKIPLNLNLNYLTGTFKPDIEDSESYNLSIDLVFENQKFVKAGRVILAMAFSFSGTEISVDSENPAILSLRNVKIKKNQLYRILST